MWGWCCQTTTCLVSPYKYPPCVSQVVWPPQCGRGQTCFSSKDARHHCCCRVMGRKPCVPSGHKSNQDSTTYGPHDQGNQSQKPPSSAHEIVSLQKHNELLFPWPEFPQVALRYPSLKFMLSPKTQTSGRSQCCGEPVNFKVHHKHFCIFACPGVTSSRKQLSSTCICVAHTIQQCHSVFDNWKDVSPKATKKGTHFVLAK